MAGISNLTCVVDAATVWCPSSPNHMLSHAVNCLQALESQSKTQLRALEAGVAALQRQIPATAGGTAVSPEAFEKLASTTHAMQRSLEQLQSSTPGGKPGKPHAAT